MISVNIYHSVKERSMQCFPNLEEAPGTHKLNKKIFVFLSVKLTP